MVDTRERPIAFNEINRAIKEIARFGRKTAEEHTAAGGQPMCAYIWIRGSAGFSPPEYFDYANSLPMEIHSSCPGGSCVTYMPGGGWLRRTDKGFRAVWSEDAVREAIVSHECVNG